MKTKELTGYGVTGIKIELNLMDRYDASHLLERINCLQENTQVIESEEPVILSHLSEALNILEMVSIFFNKIALKSSEKSDIFSPIEDEPVEEKEC